MTRKQNSAKKLNWKAVMAAQEDFLRPLIQEVVQQVMEAEMDEALGAEKGERTSIAHGLSLWVLRPDIGDACRQVGIAGAAGSARAVSHRYLRAISTERESAGGALTEMYVQGVSTRKVKAVTEELCGHEFSASTISRMNQSLDEELEKFADRRLEEAYPYLILDARYEKVREDGVIRSQAVMIAIGIDWEGRRNVLAVELANRESLSSWKDFCLALKAARVERSGTGDQ